MSSRRTANACNGNKRGKAAPDRRKRNIPPCDRGGGSAYQSIHSMGAEDGRDSSSCLAAAGLVCAGDRVAVPAQKESVTETGAQRKVSERSGRKSPCAV